MLLQTSPVICRIVFTALLYCGLAIPSADARLWSSADGKRSIEAEFVRLTETAVIVKTPEGSERSLPLNALTPEDQAEARVLQDKAEGFGPPDRPELPDDHGPVELLVLGTHICCDKAKEDFVKAAGSAGVSAEIVDRLAQGVLKARSSMDAQKAVDALVNAGFHGDIVSKSGDTDVQFYITKSRPEKVSSAKFAFANPVCCESAAAKISVAAKGVSGVESAEVAEGAYDLTVTGSFDPEDVLSVLRSYGFTATRR